MSFLEFVTKINMDRYYRVITAFGILVFLLSMFTTSTQYTKFGFLTIIYGLLSWMLCVGFYIKADLKPLPRRNWLSNALKGVRRTPLTIKITISLIVIHLLLFVIYIILSSNILF